VEVIKGSKQVALDKVPVALVESWAEPVWPVARVVVHGQNGQFDFIERERPDKGGSLRGVKRGGNHKVCKIKIIYGQNRRAQKIFKETMQDRGFSRMGENRVSIIGVQILYLVFA
jgi:hypothetical protein